MVQIAHRSHYFTKIRASTSKQNENVVNAPIRPYVWV